MLFTHYSELFKYYKRLIVLLFIGIVGGAALISVLFLVVTPLYTSTAKVNLLPTDTELAFSRTFVQSSSVNPANLLSQTHIENLLSREISQATIDRLMALNGTKSMPQATDGGLKAMLRVSFRWLKNVIRQTYNILNSGKHVPIDAYTDTILTLQDNITAEMIEGTYILEISVVWDDPDVAAAAANTLAQVYVERLQAQASDAARALETDMRNAMKRNDTNTADLEVQIQQLRLTQAATITTLRIIDRALPSIYPSFPKVVIYTLFALVGWLVVTAFVIVTADTFSNSVKTSPDLSRMLGSRSLGVLLSTDLRGDRTSHARLLEIARLLRIQGITQLSGAATLSLGSDEDSVTIASLLQKAVSLTTHKAMSADLAVAPVALGGAAQSLETAGLTLPAWIVVVARAGMVTEEQMNRVVNDWLEMGVKPVFGVLLRE